MHSLLKLLLASGLLCFVWIGTVIGQAIPGELLIQLERGVRIERVAATAEAKYGLQLEVRKQLSTSWNIWLLKTDEAAVGKALRVLKQVPEVLIVQQNHKVERRATLPDDPMFGDQWDMNNTGQNGGTVGADIGGELAWDYTTGGLTALGDTIVVAVVDGGVDLNHEDLQLWKNYAEIPNNSIDDDLNGYIDDYNGWNAADNDDNISADYHGTHVSGTIGAIGNNATGVCGVNWNVQIMPLELYSFDEAEVVEAYGYAFEMRKLYNTTNGAAGAFVVATNSSFGINYGQPEDYPLWSAMYDSMGSVGILSAGATTNFAADIDNIGDIPTSCPSPHLISVTNTTRLDKISSSAGYGLITIDLGAPGTNILSTTPNNNYGSSSGTSMATPHVAGAVALLLASACEEFIQAYHDKPDSMALIAKAYLLNGVDIISDLDGITVSGGRLNIYNSIRNLNNDHCIGCLKIEADVTPISCNGADDAAIDVEISDGVAPYTVAWSDSALAEDRVLLAPGHYEVTVTDDTGCVKFAVIAINEPAVLDVNFIITNAYNFNDGTVNAFPVGGTAPYTFQWDDPDNSTTATLTGLETGSYSLTLTDAHGCESVRTATVQDATGLRMIGPTDFLVYPNPVEGLLYISSSEPISIKLSGVDGRLVYETGEAVSGVHRIDCHTFPAGVYLLRASDPDGQLTVRKIVLH